MRGGGGGACVHGRAKRRFVQHNPSSDMKHYSLTHYSTPLYGFRMAFGSNILFSCKAESDKQQHG
mgnify:CR=1 FL=1